MTRWLVVFAFVAACKGHEVPFKPPPKDDASQAATDAGDTTDAAAAHAKQGARKVVVGDGWSCAILDDMTLRCWGRNGDGQLGIGTTTDSATPVAPKLPHVLDVVLGTAHTCALLDDKSVTCWGRINYGQKDKLLVPTGVPGVTKVRQIFAVGGASCATLENQDFVCWGDVDLEGHLRLAGAAIEHRLPTPVDGLKGVGQLSVNGAASWPTMGSGEGSTVAFWSADGIPRRTALTGVEKIASSGEHICGLRTDGSVACVGPHYICADNAPKEPPKQVQKKKPAAKKTAKKPPAKAGAKPPAPPSELPVEVLKLPPAKDLAFDVGVCVITKTGELQCLAADGCTQDAPWPGLAHVERVRGNCAQLREGSVKCWDVDRKSRVVTAIGGVANARDLAVSTSHACALRSDRELVCWGSNKFGQLGTGEIDDEHHREGRALHF